MLHQRWLALVALLWLGVFLLAASLWLLGHPQPLWAAGPSHYVAPGGTDSGNCSISSPCRMIQRAGGNASAGDEIRVAAGLYTGTVTLDKSLIRRGGFTATNWTAPRYGPTILDAQRLGRVIYSGNGVTTVALTDVHVAPALSRTCWARLNDDPADYVTVQAAVDASTQPTDVVKVAGYCAGVEARDGVTQTVYISKTLTVRGGYTTTDWTTSDPVACPTTLDALDGGRVLYITGDISPTIEGLRITGGNAAGLGGGPIGEDCGGGVYMYAMATLSNNLVFSNTADYGGGLFLGWSIATLSGDMVISNTASGNGGGLYLGDSNAVLTNTVVTDNQANTAGSGLYIEGGSYYLLHTTIARNTGGDGSGVYVTKYQDVGGDLYSTVALTNTILVSHTVGISVTGGNAVTANGILWYSTSITISQSPEATVIVQNQYQSDPAFAVDGYHLTAGSAAIERGVDAGVAVDIDGETRPAGTYPDLGADEFPAALSIAKEADQMVVGGSDVTFTITVTNTGDITLTAVTVSDTLALACERTLGILTPTVSTSYTCVVTDVATAFTNTAVVTGTPPVGPDVADTDTAFVYVITPTIEIAKTPDSQMIVSGDTVAFTISLTNTGNVTLTGVVVTDAQVPNCATTIDTLGVGISVTYPCTRANVTVDFTNTAVVTGTPPVGPDVTDTDTALVDVINPGIEIAKTPDLQTVVSGSTVTFTISVTNTGDVTLTTVAVSDNQVPDCAQTISNLMAGISTTYACTVTNVMTDFTNVAFVAGRPLVGSDVTDSDTAAVIVEEAIAGLVAINNSPTPLGSATTLTATITAGTNVVYTWSFGYGGATGNGAVVAYTYPATGTYTVVVTASNSVSVLTATTTVIITRPASGGIYLPIIFRDYTPLPLPTGPDLVVTSISVVPNPPGVGQPATVYVTVRNRGSQPVAYANNFYVDFYIDPPGPPVTYSIGDIQWGAQSSWFGVGRSYTFSAGYTFTAGAHQLYAQADTDNTVAEANESNNVLGPMPLNVTGLGSTEVSGVPAIAPSPGVGSPRHTPTPEP